MRAAREGVRHIIINTEEIKQKAPSYLLCFLVMKTVLQLFLTSYLGFSISQIITYSIEAFLIILCMNMFKDVFDSKSFLAFVFWFFLLFIMALSLNSNVSLFISDTIKTSLTCFPLFYLGRMCNEFGEDEFPVIYRGSVIVAILYVLLSMKRSSLNLNQIEYSQSMGYSLVAPIVINFLAVIRTRRVPYFFSLIILVIGIISSGARGPILCVGLGITMMMFFSTRKKGWKNIIIISISIIAIAYFYINYYEILWFIRNLVVRFNYSSRSIDLILSGNYFTSDGRAEYRSIIFEWLKGIPIIGVGPYRDRQWLFFQSSFNRSSNSMLGTYPHNIFLELLLQYGIVLGFAAILVLILLVRKSIRTSSVNIYCKSTLIILLSIGFFPLLISGSYISNEWFYALLGFMIPKQFDNLE